MPALEFHSPDSDLVTRIRQGLDRHLDIHARPASRDNAPLSAKAQPSPVSAGEEEDARIRQAALDAFFGRTAHGASGRSDD